MVGGGMRVKLLETQELQKLKISVNMYTATPYPNTLGSISRNPPLHKLLYLLFTEYTWYTIAKTLIKTANGRKPDL